MRSILQSCSFSILGSSERVDAHNRTDKMIIPLPHRFIRAIQHPTWDPSTVHPEWDVMSCNSMYIRNGLARWSSRHKAMDLGCSAKTSFIKNNSGCVSDILWREDCCPRVDNCPRSNEIMLSCQSRDRPSGYHKFSSLVSARNELRLFTNSCSSFSSSSLPGVSFIWAGSPP